MAVKVSAQVMAPLLVREGDLVQLVSVMEEALVVDLACLRWWYLCYQDSSVVRLGLLSVEAEGVLDQNLCWADSMQYH